jgi:hypothetical protein
MRIESVMVLGSPAGNLWNVLDDDNVRVARVAYHGDKLVRLKDKVNIKEAKRAIERYYQAETAR